MKIKLKNNFGKVIEEIEVDDEFGNWYNDEERKFENDSRRYRYHVRVSLDSLEYEGEVFESKYESPDEYAVRLETERRIEEFLTLLTPVQRKRIILLGEGLSEREVAKKENVNLRAIQDTRKQVQNKFIKFFGFDPRQRQLFFSI